MTTVQPSSRREPPPGASAKANPDPRPEGESPGPATAGTWRESVGVVLELFSTRSTRQILTRRHLMITDANPSVHTRRSLIERLKDWDDSSSWKEFFDTYWKLIFSVARRAGLSEAEAQDVVQETTIAVAKRMPEFRYDRSVGTFKGYLMHLTRARIADHFRRKSYNAGGVRRPREVPVERTILESHADVGTVDLESVWEDEWKAQLLAAAMDRVRQRSKAHQFQLFYLHVCKGMPAKDVAVRLKAKLPEVYFAKYKISAAIRREVKRLERRMI